MQLYKEILIKALENSKVEVEFKNIELNANEVVALQCYKTLLNIKKIVEDDSLNDEECFMKIEKIVEELEIIGTTAGSRHDF